MTKQEIEKHKKAARKLDLVKERTFEFIKRNTGKISEYDVHEFLLSEFKKQNLVTDGKNPVQIIAVNRNTAIPHYFPNKKSSAIIKKNNLIIVDIWARLNETNSPFADITYVAYSGKNIPKEIAETFKIVTRARNFALEFIKKNLKNKKLPKTKIIDRAVRNYFKKFGLEKHFLHGTGHSLGFSECHGKYFRFGKKSQAELKPNIPFAIEPGLYFKKRFGIRSEVDCYVSEEYELFVTTKIQNKIIKI